MKKQIKFPTLIGIVLLIIGIVAGVFLVQSDKIFTLQASPEEVPQQVRITNITNKSVVVSWITDIQTEGFIAFGKTSSLGMSVRQQNTSTSTQGSFAHYTTIDNLEAQATYFFKVGSGTKLFDNNGQLYQIKTAPEITVQLPSPDIIFGEIKDSSGKAVASAIVYINSLGITPQSAVVDTNGKWSIPLSTARNINLNNFANYSQDSLLEIFVQTGKVIATAKIKAGEAHPVPIIALGQNHDFTNLSSLPKGGLPTSTINLPVGEQKEPESGFEIESSGEKTSTKIITLSSISDNESINTNKPSFSGTGTIGLSFTIKVESLNVFSATILVDNKGKWSWTVPTALAGGSHLITISWKDNSGQTRNLKRNFIVLAGESSNLPAFTATSSAQQAATGSTAPISTPKPTTTPSARISYPATSSGTANAGYLTPGIVILIMSLILIFAGILIPKIKSD